MALLSLICGGHFRISIGPFVLVDLTAGRPLAEELADLLTSEKEDETEEEEEEEDSPKEVLPFGFVHIERADPYPEPAGDPYFRQDPFEEEEESDDY